MGVQPEGRWFRIGRPPRKTPSGKAFLTQPKALAVEHEALQRLAPPTRKDHQGTRHWTNFEMLPAHLRQAVYLLPKIHRLDCQSNPHLRRDLDHGPDLQNALAKPTRASPSLPSQRIVIFAPAPRSSSTVQLGTWRSCPMRDNSTNPGGGLRRDRRGGMVAYEGSDMGRAQKAMPVDQPDYVAVTLGRLDRSNEPDTFEAGKAK
jgi:hypothetical protein